jgi:hypothetical protein
MTTTEAPGAYARTDAAFERAADDFMRAHGFIPEPPWLRDAMRTVGALTMVPLVAEIERLTTENARLTRVVGNVMAGIKCPHRGGMCRLPKDHPGGHQLTDAEERLVP